MLKSDFIEDIIDTLKEGKSVYGIFHNEKVDIQSTAELIFTKHGEAWHLGIEK